MKIFVVKTFVVALAFFIVFELTISSKIKMAQEILIKFNQKSERVKIKEKIFKEIENTNKKDQILSENDRLILSEFFKKIQKELSR